MLFGALAACTPIATPVIVPTATLVPSTATPTPTEIQPSNTPEAFPSPLATQTPSIVTLQEISITPDYELSRAIIADLAAELAIPANRIQVVTIAEGRFSPMNLDCILRDGTRPIAPVEAWAKAGYRYVLLVGDRLYVYHTDGTDSFQRCPDTVPLADELLVMVDPIAADTFRVVQNRLATELDISSRRILLVSMQSVIWRDTSLGCPLPEQSYHEADIVGYRIVVSAGEEEYIFHSDSTNIYPCAAENEVLEN